MDSKTIFYIKFCVFFFFVLSSSILAKNPCNYLCADKKGKVIYLCQEQTGPYACCKGESQVLQCPTSYQLGPYPSGSIEYTKHDLRQFQDVATNNELGQAEYIDWVAKEYGETSTEELLLDFKKVDADGDQKISLAEFITFRKEDINSKQVEANIPLSYLVVLGLIVLFFCILSMKIFTKKLNNL